MAGFLFSLNVLAQKDEIKAAENAIKANNFSEAVQVLKSAEPLLATAKDKMKAQYYLALGKALFANGTQPSQTGEAAKAFKKVIDIENNPTSTYSQEAGTIFNNIIGEINKKATENYRKGLENNNDESTIATAKEYFGKSAAGFEQIYNLSEKDTAFYQNAAFIYYFAGQHDKSNEIYQKLLDLKYTGASTTYLAKSVMNDEEVAYATKAERDNQVKMKLAKEPKDEIRENQTNEIKKMIVKNYLALKQNDKALAAIEEAKKASPGDYGLLVDEANVYYAMGNNAKFKEKLEEAVKINPNDYVLHYNIGVMKSDLKDNDGAIESYQKAIELKPDYADAYNNIGAAVLAKAQPIVEEMNKNLNNFSKYDELQAKQLGIYRQALPYFEKAYQLDNKNLPVMQTLVGIYEQLEMYDQSKAVKNAISNLKN